jgi:hypothetical protein
LEAERDSLRASQFSGGASYVSPQPYPVQPSFVAQPTSYVSVSVTSGGPSYGGGFGGGKCRSPFELANSGKKFHLVSALAPHACAHLLGGVAQNDAQVTIWNKDTHGHQANLQWTIVSGPNGTYHIASAVNPDFVFHQLGANHENGGKISVWNKNSHGHQGNLQVTFENRGGDFWAIRFVHSKKCVHVQGALSDNSTAITQWDYVEQNNLKWKFVVVKGGGSGPSGGGGGGGGGRFKEWKNPVMLAREGRRCHIVSALAPHACLHLQGGVAQNDAQVTIWSKDTHGHQSNLQWTIVPGPHGTYHIASAVNPDFVLHQLGATHDNGGKISVWNKNTHGHQGNLQVRFEKVGGGYWMIKFVHSNKAVHVQGAVTSNGTAITQWDHVNQNNLKWRFVPA